MTKSKHSFVNKAGNLVTERDCPIVGLHCTEKSISACYYYTFNSDHGPISFLATLPNEHTNPKKKDS